MSQLTLWMTAPGHQVLSSAVSANHEQLWGGCRSLRIKQQQTGPYVLLTLSDSPAAGNPWVAPSIFADFQAEHQTNQARFYNLAFRRRLRGQASSFQHLLGSDCRKKCQQKRLRGGFLAIFQGIFLGGFQKYHHNHPKFMMVSRYFPRWLITVAMMNNHTRTTTVNTRSNLNP